MKACKDGSFSVLRELHLWYLLDELLMSLVAVPLQAAISLMGHKFGDTWGKDTLGNLKLNCKARFNIFGRISKKRVQFGMK